jgi:Kef-type K+ transport system membrane component KefB/CBS domain-containing protein
LIGFIFPPEQVHLSTLEIVGLSVFLGTVGAWVFQRLRIPQVVAYIVIGVVIGRSGMGLIGADTIKGLEPFNLFALGIIGFLIGGELRQDVLRKHGKKFLVILLAEGMGAFVAVGLLVGAVCWLTTGNLPLAVALGLVLGAISSATAPAATVNVLWEFKTRGPLSRAVFAMVALDDGLALVLYSIAAAVATGLTGQGEGGLVVELAQVARELLGGAALGVGAGLVLNLALRHTGDREMWLTFVIGTLALVIGVGHELGVDTILSAMALGATIANWAPQRSKQAFSLVEAFAPPIFVLFFVSVGAQMNLRGMAGWMWALAGVYVIGRTAGKMVGATLGARLSGAADTVRKYLGLCLFSQAGVAVGLSVAASHRFAGETGTAIIMIIGLTTFLVQIIGPPCVRLAVKKAGEIGMNVTEEDLLASYSARDVIARHAPSFSPDTPLEELLRAMAETNHSAYGVVDDQGKLTGVISIQELRRAFMSKDLAKFLVAEDMMEPHTESVSEGTPLAEAIARMRELGVESLPVTSRTDGTLLGILDKQTIDRAVARELKRREELAAD